MTGGDRANSSIRVRFGGPGHARTDTICRERPPFPVIAHPADASPAAAACPERHPAGFAGSGPRCLRGARSTAVGERSDDGSEWTLDFGLTYRRMDPA